MSGHNCVKETYSFDAKLTDSTGKAISVDCTLQLPSVWGQEVGISLTVPHVEMPVRNFENPCELRATDTEPKFQIEMKELWYRYMPGSVSPARKFGASSVTMTHVANLSVVDRMPSSDNKFYVCISHVDFLSDNVMVMGAEQIIEDIVSFCCPKLGNLTLQRYWTKSRLDSSDSFVLNSGFWLEITTDQHNYTIDQILRFVAPILDVLSIFFRQRVVVVGWQSLREGVRTRSWSDPIEPLQTSYVSVEPNRYLVSMDELSRQVNSAIDAYYKLGERERSFIFSLSYSLCPAISLRDGERFMSLFRVLESIATKCSQRKSLTDAEKATISKLEDVANSMQESSPEVSGRVRGFSKKLASGEPSLTTKILDFIGSYNVVFSGLWSIKGDRGLVGIRHKLAHGGANYIHHQGLAVATFHLSLLSERVACSLLGLTLKDGHRGFRRDEWLEMNYVKGLKARIFDARRV